MKRLQHMWRITSILLLTLVGGVSSFAQDVVFYLQSSAPKMGIEDRLQIQYTIKNVSNLQSINPDPSINKDFDIIGGPYSSQSNSVSITNGKMTQSLSISVSYVVKPKRKGTLTIPEGIAVDGNGDKYKSNKLSIEVVDGSLMQQRQPQRRQNYNDPFEALRQQRQRQLQALRQRQQQLQQQRQQQAPISSEEELGKNIFIKVIVDKNKAYIGEQITATYKLYARIPMNVSISKLPSLNGFWTQDFDIPKGSNIKPSTEVIDGQQYQVFTLKKSALFPQQTGTLELDPAEAEGVARIIQRVQDPFADDPFFQNAFGSLSMNDPFFNDDFFSGRTYKDVKVKLKSKPIKIEVLPLPTEEQPGGFGGAVGDFSISRKLDKSEITTDNVATLTVEIKGSGNLKLIQPPVLDLPNGLTTYDPIVVDTITSRSTTIKGIKRITYTITPRMPGTYKLPALSFSYYNPKSNTYESLETEEATLSVKPGENYTTNKDQDISITDIHGIYTAAYKSNTTDSPLLLTVGYWSMYALPLLGFLGIVLWKRREEELAQNTAFHRSKRANKVALKRLATAKKLLNEDNRPAFYEEISKAVWLYLSDKLHIPLSSLSKENVLDVLEQYSISTDLQNDLNRIINDCEIALYASSSDSAMNNTYQDTVSVISKLEESFKK